MLLGRRRVHDRSESLHSQTFRDAGSSPKDCRIVAGGRQTTGSGHQISPHPVRASRNKASAFPRRSPRLSGELFSEQIHRRGAKNAELAQRKTVIPTDSSGVPTRIFTTTGGLLQINRDSTSGYFLSTLSG